MNTAANLNDCPVEIPRIERGPSARFRGKLANPELEALARTMTLQVAMIGSDGWVLASDMAVFGQHPTADRAEGRPAFLSTTKLVSKIVCRRDLHFIYAFFGDVDQVAAKAGRLLEERTASCPEPERRRALLAAIADELSGVEDSGLLVIFWEPQTELWEVHIGREPVRCARLTFGGAGNLALYYPFRFYGRNNPLSVKDLKFLAAYTILEGHEINPTVIEDLELWYAERGKVTKAGPDELAAIRQRADRFNKNLRRRLLASSSH